LRNMQLFVMVRSDGVLLTVYVLLLTYMIYLMSKILEGSQYINNHFHNAVIQYWIILLACISTLPCCCVEIKLGQWVGTWHIILNIYHI
jgi:hypothetical protein